MLCTSHACYVYVRRIRTYTYVRLLYVYTLLLGYMYYYTATRVCTYAMLDVHVLYSRVIVHNHAHYYYVCDVCVAV